VSELQAGVSGASDPVPLGLGTWDYRACGSSSRCVCAPQAGLESGTGVVARGDGFATAGRTGYGVYPAQSGAEAPDTAPGRDAGIDPSSRFDAAAAAVGPAAQPRPTAPQAVQGFSGAGGHGSAGGAGPQGGYSDMVWALLGRDGPGAPSAELTTPRPEAAAQQPAAAQAYPQRPPPAASPPGGWASPPPYALHASVDTGLQQQRWQHGALAWHGHGQPAAHGAAARSSGADVPFGTDVTARELLVRSKALEDTLMVLCAEKQVRRGARRWQAGMRQQAARRQCAGWQAVGRSCARA
jgi:hypothetical protein